MPTAVRFAIDENLDGAYTLTVDNDSQMVSVRVSGSNDLVFAQRLYNDDTKLHASALTMDARTFARKLADFYRHAGITTTVNSG